MRFSLLLSPLPMAPQKNYYKTFVANGILESNSSSAGNDNWSPDFRDNFSLLLHQT